MKTAELIQNGNLYRALGGECWLATFEVVKTENNTRLIRPMVRKVCVESTNGSAAGVTVRPLTGDTRYISAQRDSLFDDRDDAQAASVALCEEMDGSTVMGQIGYRYQRPKARKPKAAPIEVRVKQVRHDGYIVEKRDPETRRWRPVYGLPVMTRWKANDSAKRIRCGLEVPGYWMMPDTGEFIELCSYVD